MTNKITRAHLICIVFYY